MPNKNIQILMNDEILNAKKTAQLPPFLNFRYPL